MATKTITWTDGTTATLTYTGQGNGTIVVQSDPNNHYDSRSAQVVVRTTDGSISRTITIVQAAKVRTDISNAVVTAANQTYSGSAKTPTPTVTLNGETIPSSGYDVAYSNNTNAGTATITITGKGDYTGTATGSFTIAKANPAYTAPTARNGLTYSGSSQYLVTEGSTSHGTIQYSSNGTSWSTTRPSSINAGSYTTYWRLVGDSNHNDVASTSLSTTIAKASRTISFADSYVVLNTSSNVTKTATPSTGSGDGAITYSISSTTYATINSSSGKVTSKTSDGSAVVTATIAEGTNYLSASGSYTLYVFATTHDYSYSGSYSAVTLPPGTYQFQCWGAQGGSNAAASTYGITAQAGGKGGYSVGQLTVSQATNVRVYVGGQGSASAGGYNGGGSTVGTSSKDANNILGVTKKGGGGGATDIRLSDGSLYSRMIVAGGGSGGVMAYKAVTTSTSQSYTETSITSSGGIIDGTDGYKWYTGSPNRYYGALINVTSYRGGKAVISISSGNGICAFLKADPVSGSVVQWASGWSKPQYFNSTSKWTVPSDAKYLYIVLRNGDTLFDIQSVTFTWTETSTTETRQSQVGYAGGGTNGIAGVSDYAGKQSAAGSGGSFGQGRDSTVSSYRFTTPGAGGGWYGGGSYGTDDSDITKVKYSGGGSGWVNTSASAGNRPSGYTGLQLDSGSTTAGNSSFPAPSGGNETGHAGNGYARITRLS